MLITLLLIISSMVFMMGRWYERRHSNLKVYKVAPVRSFRQIQFLSDRDVYHYEGCRYLEKVDDGDPRLMTKRCCYSCLEKSKKTS